MTDFLGEHPEFLHDLPFSYGLQHLLIERLREVLGPDEAQINPEDPKLQQAIAEVCHRAMPERKVRPGPPLTEYVLTRLFEVAQEVMKPQEEGKTKPKRQKRHFGSEYLKWLGQLDPSSICLLLADYDPERALKLYWRVDKKLVEWAAHQRLESDWQQAQLMFEGPLYGFGGGYKEGEAETTDLKSADDWQSFADVLKRG